MWGTVMCETYNNFKKRYPDVEKHVVEYKQITRLSVLITLDTDDKYIYSDADHAIYSYDEWRDDFRICLKKILLKEGITQKELAELSGVSRQLISSYLRGVTAPGYSNALKIADALGRPLSDFRIKNI